jgi:1-acyl-sn-glycerol-3-phosphate acyltransferase
MSTKLHVSGNLDLLRHPEKYPNLICFSNHSTHADWWVMFAISWYCRCIGQLKIYLKAVARYLPAIGWGLRMVRTHTSHH